MTLDKFKIHRGEILFGCDGLKFGFGELRKTLRRVEKVASMLLESGFSVAFASNYHPTDSLFQAIFDTKNHKNLRFIP